ncbi:FAD-dependent oxidoreductase [Nucisporomicrobium flavum]|uniref:FAD-dependent oxidoreductase n=1 Tax=Nucisporomicrobium flavum TaxID=2785915 RepID=UPI0018F533AE|nr:FAD-binding monooxygenase [Nucisporomicrobium flavum]
MPTSNRNHALVLGGSIAGLLAARVLADRYATVTIVERDRLPSGAEHRRGVPHGRHAHGLLPQGLQIMEELLPGLTADIERGGGMAADILGNCRWYLNGRLLRQAHAGLPALAASRPLIEGEIRRRVRELPNVTVLDGHDITGLCASADGGRIIGAAISGAQPRTVKADLVVDATGRGTRTPRWLAELGFEPPPADRVSINLAYTSCVYDEPPGVFGDDVFVITARFPGQRRSSVMQRLEGGQVLVTLAGVLGERPPETLDGMPGYARTLAMPDTYEVVSTAKPLSRPIPFRYPSYVRYRYENLAAFPAGLLVAGDAVCGFNPVYGQGMSIAAMNAYALSKELEHDGEPDPHRYFTAVSRHLEAPWRLAVGADLALPGVTGPALPESPLTGEYVGRLQLAAADDEELAKAFIRVTGLVDSPAALLRPEIVERVQRAGAPVVSR